MLQGAPWLVLGIYVLILGRLWHLMSPWGRAALGGHTAAQSVSIAWRHVSPANHARRKLLIDFLLRTTTLGLGMVAHATHIMLDDFVEGLPAEGGAGVIAETIVAASRLLFASQAPLMLICSLVWSLPLSLSFVAQMVLVATTARYNRLVCTATALSAPAHVRGTHRVFRAAWALALATPLSPAAALVEPDSGSECALLITFLQLFVGGGVPLAWQAISQARIYQRRQQQRLRVGLQPERGVQAALYGAAWWLLAEGWDAVLLLGWLVAALCFDACILILR